MKNGYHAYEAIQSDFQVFELKIKTTRVNGWFVLRLKASTTGQPLKGH